MLHIMGLSILTLSNVPVVPSLRLLLRTDISCLNTGTKVRQVPHFELVICS